MKNVLEKILKEYLKEKENSPKNNKLFRYLSNNSCQKDFYDLNVLDESKYIVKSSGGIGAWGIIPWIGIFDKDISVSAAEGYDIVYLFSADMKKVYLSLNQGWTYFKNNYSTKKAKENIKKVTTVWKEILRSNLNDFSFEEINLEYKGKNSDLPTGYELGHICGKCYYVDNLPDEVVLIRDLQNMLTVFRELKGNLIDLNVRKTNNHWLSEYESNFVEEKKESNSIENQDLDSIISNEAENTALILKKELPNIKIKNNQNVDANKTSASYKTDYVQIMKSRSKLGLAGELMVINYERKRLNKFGIFKEVEHVSKISNDKAGYDIKSYDKHGNEIHIEVKTTKKREDEPFFLTRNEYEYSIDNADKYKLYRIYNFNPSTGKGDFYIIEGDITEEIEFETEVYISARRKK